MQCEGFPLNGDGIYHFKPTDDLFPKMTYPLIIDDIHFSATLEISYSDIVGWVLRSNMVYFDPMENNYDKSNIAKAFFGPESIDNWDYTGVSCIKDNYRYTIYYNAAPIENQVE